MKTATRRWTELTLGLGLLALAGACGDDGGPGSVASTDGSTGATDDGSTGGGASNTMNMTQASQSGDSGDSSTGSADSSGGGDSSSGGPAGPVMLSGEVEDLVFTASIPDAEISVWMTPGFETTSDMDGLWSLDAVDPNQEIVFQIAPSTDFVGSLIPYGVGDMDDDDVRLAQISRTFLSDQEMLLMDQNPEPVDPNGAILITRLISNTTLLAGPVTVEMSPAPTPGTFYAPDDGGAPVLDSNQMQFQLIPVVVFFNLPETDPGDITFTFSHDTDTCETAFTQFPTLGDHITLVDVTCS